MPRLNMLAIWVVAFVSLFCYQRVGQVREAVFLAEAMETIGDESLVEVSRQQLFDAAMHGMTSELDRFSRFIPRDESERFRQQLDNHFPGIGIRIRIRKDEETEKIELVVEDTVIGTPQPAHDAGLRSGDRLVAVNGRRLATSATAGDDEIPPEDATKFITGPAGTDVTLTVERDGELLDFAVTRQEIEVDSILGDTRNGAGEWIYRLAGDPRIGYIRIDSFSDNTLPQLRLALDQLAKGDEMQALLLDLRDNPGGYLRAAVELCDLFIDADQTDINLDRRIVSTRDRFGKDHEVHRARNGDVLPGVPIVVLVNGQSASASEIFAACLQDYGRAVVCGSRTFGKGSVQKVVPLERGRSLLKITTNTFWRPSDQQIHKMDDATDEDAWGVRPDDGFAVELSEDEEERRRDERRARDVAQHEQPATFDPEIFDPQLQRAVDHLVEQLEKKPR
ncbi:MAG: S41 family peptidase [Planctomycetota bacterium]|nr:MAG: S41 family peptidase [Planctomycetota bacterium]REJ92734.1 MAG: S41 family peptidase [Planctomycetota bacterium]REK23772.1 MAG: S41 family peptidase [Planctomycetota bacterium]REK47625.1 MAG: S41 family peptidase [Planctomycetota bacterium]